MKNNKGITLIALVITIIVLIILAGVGLAAITGNNGIFDNASTAALETDKGTILESLRLEIYNKRLNDVRSKNNNTEYLQNQGIIDENGVLDVSKISDELETGKGTLETGDVYYIINGGELYYLDNSLTEHSLGSVYVEPVPPEEGIFTYSDEAKTILTGVQSKYVQVLGESTQKGAACDIIDDEGNIVTEITIPKQVKELDYNSLNSFVNLETVNFESDSTLEIIGEEAFACCYALKNISIPTSVTRINSYAFLQCTMIESLTIPSSVSRISATAFDKWTSTQTIYIEGKTSADDFESFYYSEEAKIEYLGN